jgi:hypothetical protein
LAFTISIAVDPVPIRAFGRQQGQLRELADEAKTTGAHAHVQDEVCAVAPSDLEETPFIQLFRRAVSFERSRWSGTQLRRGDIESCIGRNSPTCGSVTVAYCDDGEHEINFLVGATLFPDARHCTPSSGAGSTWMRPVWERGIWDGSNETSDIVPDVIICTGFKLHPALLEARRKLQKHPAFRGSYGGLQPQGWGVDRDADDTQSAIFWPQQKLLKINPPTYRRGRWPLIVGISHEPMSHTDGKDWDLAVMTHVLDDSPAPRPLFDTCPTMYMPWALASFSKRHDHVLGDLVLSQTGEAKLQRRLSNPDDRQFCAFVYNNCGLHWDSAVRIAFFKLLSKYKHVDAIGDCMHNMPDGAKTSGERFVETKRGNSRSFYDLNVGHMSKYKFVISFENSQFPGYFTEKLINPVLAGSVPIYWGAADIGRYVNTSRLVHCSLVFTDYQRQTERGGEGFKAGGSDKKHGEPWPKRVEPHQPGYAEYLAEIERLVGGDNAMRGCIAEVERLDKDPAAYRRVLETPFLHGNKLSGVFNVSRLGAGLREVMVAADEGRLAEEDGPTADSSSGSLDAAEDGAVRGLFAAARESIDKEHAENKGNPQELRATVSHTDHTECAGGCARWEPGPFWRNGAGVRADFSDK